MRVAHECNERTHGVRFEDAATIFEDDFAILLDDPIHSQDEARFIMLGETAAGLLLSSAHVERGARIRLINARPAIKRERRIYDGERRA